jgi:pilus assembly protein CpaF
MDKRALNSLSTLNQIVIKKLRETQKPKSIMHTPLREIFSGYRVSGSLKREENILDLAQKGSKKYRRAVKEMIIPILSGDVKIKEREIDRILEGYYINYYGTCDEISSTNLDLLTSKLNKILIRKDADIEVKLEKLAQVCFQECYGYGVLDEFCNLGVDERSDKVEEIAMSGGNHLLIKISGVDFKLDKLYYPEEQLAKIVNRLSKTSLKKLSQANPKAESELLDGSRINLQCPPLNATNSFNIRIHYGDFLTKQMLINRGSTTQEFEDWKDLLMEFKPRIIVVGGQGVGKSTATRDLFKRYPMNTTVASIESAFELGLEKLPNLYVNRLRAGVLPIDSLLESLFRLNAKVIGLGEARTGQDVYLYTQAAKRTTSGTVCTWHEDDAKEAVYDMANSLVHAGYAGSLEEAIQEVCRSADIIFVNRCCDEYSKDPGLRHTSVACELPKEGLDKNGELNIRILWQYDYEEMKLYQEQGISKTLEHAFLQRNFNPQKIKGLVVNGEFYEERVRKRGSFAVNN